MRKWSAGLVVCVVSLLPVSAAAQLWLQDRASSEGPGFKLGDSMVLHLGLGAEGGYDTNAVYRSDDVVDAGRLRITPYIDLATRGDQRRVKDEGVVDATPPKASFKLGVAGFWDQYFAEEQRVKDVSDFGIDTHLNFVLFPEGNFSLLLDALYLRTLQPYESASDARARQQVEPSIGVRVRPGGGTLSLELGYRLRFMYFEDDLLGDQNNRHGHEARFETRWKVFPKTALIGRVTFTPTVYYESGSMNENSLPVRSWAGLQGLFTDRFGLMLLGGYGASFYNAGPNFDSFLARGELMFFITPFSQIRLGGQRDFVDSFYANFYVKNGGYLSYQQMIGGVVMLTLKGDVFYRDYARFDGPTFNGATPSHQERNDVWAEGSLLVEWRATDWLSFHASGKYTGDITDFYYQSTYQDPSTGTQTTIENDAGFHKFVVLGGVRGHY
jgi:hypothetical protein